MNERAQVIQVAAETMAVHADGIHLLRGLTNQANSELADTDKLNLTDAAVQFRVAVLSLTINHAWKMAELIESGYPRVALSLARVLRESHIAVLWSIEQSAFVAETFAALRESPSLERGSWPESGDMAKQVSRALEKLGHSQAADWDHVLQQYGNTHNQLFAHAISNFSLTTSLVQDGRFTPIVGPVYVPALVEIAIDHLIPLYSFMLNDASKIAAAVLGRPVPEPTAELLRLAGEWWKEHPPVQVA